MGRFAVSHPAALPRLSLSLLWLCAGTVAVGIAVASPEIRSLLVSAMAQVRPLAVLATLPGQMAGSLLCAAALFVLRPGVSFGPTLASRLLRDAGANLLVFMPGLGDVIGTRAIVLAGGRTRAAVTASLLDTIAETVAQVPYVILAVLVLPGLWHQVGHAPTDDIPLFPAWRTGGLIALAGLLFIALLLARYGRRTMARLMMSAKAELAYFCQEMRGQRRGMPAAIGLHLLAWAMGGIQLWLAAWALGSDLGLFDAIVIESAAYAGRAILFFIPAGLAIQEAVLVVAGLAFGLAPEQSLALALVLRLRDLVFGVPLLLWPLLEYRHRARRGGLGTE
jgi:hypothetical protein